MPTACDPQALVSEELRKTAPVGLEELLGRLPQLTWNQVFQAVDALSRRGAILLRRRGFEYELHPAPARTIAGWAPAVHATARCRTEATREWKAATMISQGGGK